MDVFDRPLFQNRAARDRLKDMGNVPGFAPGGEVSFDSTGAIRRPVRSEVSSVGPRPSVRPSALEAAFSPFSRDILGLPSLTEAFQTGIPMSPGMIFDNLVVRAGSTINDPGTVMQALNEKLTDPNLRPNERRALKNQRDALNFAIEAGYGATDAVTDALSVLQSLGSGAIEYGVAPVVSTVSPELGEMIYDQIPMFDATAEELALMGQAVPSNLRPSDTPKRVAFEAAGRGTPPSPESVALPQRRTGPGTPGDRQGPMAYSSPEKVAAVAEAATGPSTMEADARDRGPLLSDPAAVAAGLNAEDPEVRDKTIADFMQEFTSAAPKYEGVDKGLLLAQIGFAIAAGESPNAMQNIANGLLAGSDMMLKDKAAKAEFDRQLQLSAMQYGLQEVGKQRARSEQALNFVALEDTVYKGRKVKAGDSVYIPYGEIEKNGGVVPSGFGDSSMVTAITDRAKAVSEAIEKARQENLVDDTFAESQREKFSRAASTAISAERGLGYMESAILKVAEKGNIAGLAGAKDDLVAKVAAAAGLEDINQQFNNREEVQGLVRKAFQNLIPAALSGVQTANSISNRDIEILADAYVNSMLEDGIFSMSTITEDKLLNSMKGAVDLLESERQQSLMDMGTIEKTLMGRTLRSGAEATSIIQPYRELLPGQGSVSPPRRLGSLVYGEDGIYEIVRPGN